MTETRSIQRLLHDYYSDSALVGLLELAENNRFTIWSYSRCLLGMCDGGYKSFTINKHSTAEDAIRNFIGHRAEKEGLDIQGIWAGKKSRAKLAAAVIPLIHAEINIRAATEIPLTLQEVVAQR